MFFLLFLLLNFIEIYAVIVLLYLGYLLYRRRKLPAGVLLTWFLCLAVTWYLVQAIREQKLVLYGSYIAHTTDYGEGLANIYTAAINLGIIFLFFLATQVVFGIIFFARMKTLNT